MKKPGFDDFERLVRENQRVVYQIAFGLLGNASDAEDVTQDAFVLAFTKATSLRKPERFRSWVCRIARNLALNRIRTDNRSRRREDLAAGGNAASEGLDAHLRDCAACTAELERRRALARRMDAAVNVLVRAEPPPRLLESITARARSTQRWRRSMRCSTSSVRSSIRRSR